jgi:hypothetical protein
MPLLRGVKAQCGVRGSASSIWPGEAMPVWRSLARPAAATERSEFRPGVRGVLGTKGSARIGLCLPASSGGGTTFERLAEHRYLRAITLRRRRRRRALLLQNER